MIVLAVMAHPDDAEFRCAGTLIKCKQRGDEVWLCTINNGSMGHVEIMPDELSEMRKKEAKAACDLVGINYITTDIGDLQSYYQSREHRDLLIDVFRKVNPDLIFIHNPDDYMCDHIAASKLAFDAAFAATVPHYITKYPAIDKIAPIYFVEPDDGLNFIPTEYVDISDVYDQKIEMLRCHKTQDEWLRVHDGIDYTESCRVLSEFRGMQCKVKYAEAFRPCLVSPRIVTKRLLP